MSDQIPNPPDEPQPLMPAPFTPIPAQLSAPLRPQPNNGSYRTIRYIVGSKRLEIQGEYTSQDLRVLADWLDSDKGTELVFKDTLSPL